MCRIERPSLLALAALFTISATPLVAQPTRPIPLAEVHCDARRLHGLLDRTTFSSRQGAKPIQLNWTFGSRDGDFAGIALTTQWLPPTVPFNSEKHLWFELDRDAMPLARNSAARLQKTLTLTRVATASDLRPSDDREALFVNVNPTESPNPAVAARLRIDNLTSGIATTTRRGSGLEQIAEPCHSAFTDVDVHVFRVLARLFRSFAYNCCGSSSDQPQYQQSAVIYRGAEATRRADGTTRTAYRIDAEESEGDARLAIEVLVDVDPDGRLGRGSIRRLPNCTSAGQRDCSREGVQFEGFLVRPAPAGDGYPDVEIQVCNTSIDGSPCSTEPLVFNFAALLSGTDWAERP